MGLKKEKRSISILYSGDRYTCANNRYKIHHYEIQKKIRCYSIGVEALVSTEYDATVLIGINKNSNLVDDGYRFDEYKDSY